MPVVDDAFRTFAVDPPYAARTIRKTLNNTIVAHTEQIASGYAKDWADYQNRVGFINGLRHAIEICDEMEKQERK
jgi:aspartate/tyrosine/aromatic aminotransferase